MKSNKSASRLLCSIIICNHIAELDDINSENLNEKLEHYAQNLFTNEIDDRFIDLEYSKNFAKNLLLEVTSSFEKLNELISVNSNKENSHTIIPKLLQAIILCGLAELSKKESPTKVVISEYINLAKLYFKKKEVSYVNAVLDKFSKITEN